jgi:hypothetical protein
VSVARKAWLAANRLRLNRRQRERIAANPEKERARQRRQRETPHGRQAERSRARRWRLKEYGLTPDQYNVLSQAQSGLCAICKLPDSSGHSLSVDHTHDTGRVRGLLCKKCNFGLGYFLDDPARLLNAAVYLGGVDR